MYIMNVSYLQAETPADAADTANRSIIQWDPWISFLAAWLHGIPLHGDSTAHRYGTVTLIFILITLRPQTSFFV